MQSENKLFDDFVKMVNGFAGTMAGMGREAESGAREKFRDWMAGSDFVGRDEFEIQFSDIFDQILAYGAGKPINVINPEVLAQK